MGGVYHLSVMSRVMLRRESCHNGDQVRGRRQRMACICTCCIPYETYLTVVPGITSYFSPVVLYASIFRAVPVNAFSSPPLGVPTGIAMVMVRPRSAWWSCRRLWDGCLQLSCVSSGGAPTRVSLCPIHISNRFLQLSKEFRSRFILDDYIVKMYSSVYCAL